MDGQRSVAVIGGGNFGTALANLLAENGCRVLLWMRDPKQVEYIKAERKSPRYLKGIDIHLRVEPTVDLQQAIEPDLLFIALPSVAIRTVLRPIAPQLDTKKLVSMTKGIEADTFLLMSQILEELAPHATIGVLSGPNLAQEIAEHTLTATVIASESSELCMDVQTLLHSPSFRVYASNDRYGVELGGALKNVYAIMSGMTVSLGMGENTRAMLITRALAEMTRFAVKLGANPMTFLGLAGVGDLLVTCNSSKSRNYRVGYALGQGVSLDEAVQEIGEVAEGVNTLKVLHAKAESLNIYMPLVAGLYAIIFGGVRLETVIKKLMEAEPKTDVDFISTAGF